MKKFLNGILMSMAVVMATACPSDGTKGRTKIPHAGDDTETEEEETINIPFKEEAGVKFVTAKINGVPMDMIFDTGCSTTYISLLEAKQLVKRGLLTIEDYQGTEQLVIADGSITEGAVFNIRSLELSDGKSSIICYDIPVTVSLSIYAPVLLGNTILNEVDSYTIDNEGSVIKFKPRQ